jgi:hypothetical protein
MDISSRQRISPRRYDYSGICSHRIVLTNFRLHDLNVKLPSLPDDARFRRENDENELVDVFANQPFCPQVMPSERDAV